MNLLIRYVRKKGKSEEIEQTHYVGEKLQFGRGTDQDIHLPGAAVSLSHAILTATKSGFKVEAQKGSYCIFKGRIESSITINHGQSFNVSGHRIQILPGTDKNVDAIIEVTINEGTEEKLRDRFNTRISQLNISKRGWSWILFVSILVLFLVIPLTGVFSPSWMNTLRDSALPDDSVWLAGGLHRSHRFIGEQCEQCHVAPFAQVDEAQCVACHANTSAHLDKQYYALQAEDYSNCTDCHKEHSSSFNITNQSQQVCAECHQDLQQSGLDSISYHAATDFETVHPGFSVSLLQPIGDEETIQWVINRQSLSTADLQEQSHLKFSHQLHLSTSGLNSPDGNVILGCVDCHEQESGGSVMLPIEMDKHCQQCHQLNFDPEDPKRFVPHGSAEEVVMMLREYYGFRYVYQNLIAQDLDNKEIGDLFDVREARRPGRTKPNEADTSVILDEKTSAMIEELTKQGVRTEALQWAESKALQAASSLFEKQACQTCHVVDIDHSKAIPWRVKPIRLTEHWFPLAEFSHEKHELMQCSDCHQAYNSSMATDVLMPDINNCRQCHGGEASKNLIPSSCTECHQYHFENGSLLPHYVPQKPLENTQAGGSD